MKHTFITRISNLKSPSSWAKLLLVLVLAILAIPQLWYPLWFDQGAFAACADILRHGGVMFRDCFDVRGPAVDLVYLIALYISPSPVTIHALDLLCQALTAGLIGLLARRLWNVQAGIAAGVLYWLMYASINYWATAQAESFANLFFVLAVYAAWQALETERSGDDPGAQDRQAIAWLALSGACVGVLFWFKYPFALIGLLPMLLILLHSKRTGSQMKIRPSIPDAASKAAAGTPSKSSRLVSLAAGALAVLLLGFAYFALSGALHNLQSQIAYDMITFNDVTFASRLDWLRTSFWEEITAFVRLGNTPTAGFKDTVSQVSILGRGYPFIFALMVWSLLTSLLAWLGIRRKRSFVEPANPVTVRSTVAPQAGVSFLWAYFALTLMINLWQGHFYRYHFLIMLPCMALLAAANFRFSLSDMKAKSHLTQPLQPIRIIRDISRRIGYILHGALYGAAVLGLAACMVPWAHDALGNVVLQHKSPNSLYLESKLAPYSTLAGALARQTTSQDRIAIFSDVPAVYALAQRLSGTRFIYVRPLQEAGSAELRTTLAQVYLHDLERSRPRFFILTQPGFPWDGADFIALWKSLPAIHAFVEANYHYVGENGPFLLFVSNGS